jgi:hypothetical protein
VGQTPNDDEHHLTSTSRHQYRVPTRSTMPSFRANDGVNVHYSTHGSSSSAPLILVPLSQHFSPDHFNLLALPAPRLHRLQRRLLAQRLCAFQRLLCRRTRSAWPWRIRKTESRVSCGTTGHGSKQPNHPSCASSRQHLSNRHQSRRRNSMVISNVSLSNDTNSF